MYRCYIARIRDIHGGSDGAGSILSSSCLEFFNDGSDNIQTKVLIVMGKTNDICKGFGKSSLVLIVLGCVVLHHHPVLQFSVSLKQGL